MTESKRTLETAVFTVSDEGTRVKNDLVMESMNRLYKLSSAKRETFRVRGAHLGINSEINRMISSYFPEIQVIPVPEGNFLERAKKGMQYLFSSLKRSIAETAANEKPLSIVYMEGDKPDFVPQIEELVNPLLEGRAEVIIPTRSKGGFSQFPAGQRFWENRANKAVAEITGRDIDTMYGPRAWNSECALYFGNCAIEDFGALTYSVVRAMLEGKKVETLEVPGYPQPDYMSKYALPFRIPGLHFAYRALQNLPHFKAAESAKKDASRRK